MTNLTKQNGETGCMKELEKKLRDRTVKRAVIRNVKSLRHTKTHLCDAIKLENGQIFLQFKNPKYRNVETIALEDMIEEIEVQLK